MWSPWIPNSMMVLSPISITCSSSCLRVFSTTSSILAGWILPSLTNLCKAKRAISLLNGSNEERTIASGVSSTTRSTPVAASIARILRPSLPIIWPFISSLSNWKTVTVFSIVCSAAVLCILWMMIFLASLFAFWRASSMISCCKESALVWASCLRLSINWAFASSALSPPIFSSFLMCSSWCFSSSFLFWLMISICLFKCSLMVSFSFTCLSRVSVFWLICCSFCLILFSASAIFLFFSKASLSWSDLSWTNFSFASKSFSFLRFSALNWASLRICSACFLASSTLAAEFFEKMSLPSPSPTNAAVIPVIMGIMSCDSMCYCFYLFHFNPFEKISMDKCYEVKEKNTTGLLIWAILRKEICPKGLQFDRKQVLILHFLYPNLHFSGLKHRKARP